MVEPPPNTKTIPVRRKRVLKNGEVKEYITTETYKVKGCINPDGTVTKFSNEQKAEIKRLRATGVTITRLAKDYNTSKITISKIVDG